MAETEPVSGQQGREGQCPAGRLGFGCAGLMASLDRAASRRLIDAAFECGIRHFDAARSYGYGAAEGVLGDFLRRRRHEVTVTTKLGILPPRRTVVGPLRTAARTIARAVPSLRPMLRGRAQSMQRSTFDVPQLEQSLATSLRELRTDYVDFLLLHECSANDYEDEAVQRFLDRCLRDGKARRVGVATTVPAVQAILRSPRGAPSVAQFPSSLCEDNYERLALPPGTLAFTHSSLGSCFQGIARRLEQHPGLAARWSAILDVDVEAPGALSRLLLEYALMVNQRGMVIFSSRSVLRVRQNAAVQPARARREVLLSLRRLERESDAG